MPKGYIRRYRRRSITFADNGTTQYMHQIACLYIVVPKQKWNNTYLKTRSGEYFFQTFASKIKSYEKLELLSSFK